MPVSAVAQRGKTKRQPSAPAQLAPNTLKRIGNELRHATQALSRAADTLEAPPGWLYARRTKRPHLPAGRLDGIEETAVAVTLRRLRIEGRDTRMLEGMLLRSLAPTFVEMGGKMRDRAGTLELQDLVQEAGRVILERLDQYDPERQPLSVCARIWGREAMERLVERQRADVHLSDYARQWTRAKGGVKKFGRHGASDATRTAITHGPNEAVPLASLVETPRQLVAGDDPERAAAEHEERVLLKRTIEQLPRTQREVLARVYGLGRRQKQTIGQIAKSLRMKPARVHAALQAGMTVLRARMEA